MAAAVAESTAAGAGADAGGAVAEAPAVAAIPDAEAGADAAAPAEEEAVVEPTEAEKAAVEVRRAAAVKSELGLQRRKGCINEMASTFETMRERRETLDVWLRDAFAKRIELQQRLVDAKKRQADLIQAMPTTRRTKLRMDRLLRGLEAGGAAAQLAMRELSDAETPPEAAAARLRAAYAAAAARTGAAPEADGQTAEAETGDVQPLEGPQEDPGAAVADAGAQAGDAQPPARAQEDSGAAAADAGAQAGDAQPPEGPQEDSGAAAADLGAQAGDVQPPEGPQEDSGAAAADAGAQEDPEAAAEGGVQVSAVSIETGPVTLNALRYSPPASGLPVLVFFHGGAYVAGDLATHGWTCRCLAARAGAEVLAVAYRRAPEAQFPSAFEDAYAALRWVAAGGLGAPPPALGVAGDNCGAGLALACCLRAREDGGPSIAAQLLLAPWLDLRPSSPSMLAATEAGAAYLADLSCGRALYAPPLVETPPAAAPSQSDGDGDGATGRVELSEYPLGDDGQPWFQDLRASPLLAESLAGLPPAFVVLPAAAAPLASDGSQLVKRLRADGGKQAVKKLRLEDDLGPDFAARSAAPRGALAVAVRPVLHAAADFAAGAWRPTAPA